MDPSRPKSALASLPYTLFFCSAPNYKIGKRYHSKKIQIEKKLKENKTFLKTKIKTENFADQDSIKGFL